MYRMRSSCSSHSHHPPPPRRRASTMSTSVRLSTRHGALLTTAIVAVLVSTHIEGFSSSHSRRQSHHSPLKGQTSRTLLLSSATSSGAATKRSNGKHQAKKRRKKRSGVSYTAAKSFNSQLTKCNDSNELMTAFMTRTSANKSSPATSGTHLGGADKVNSVNFSTCLHRLARFASQNNQNRGSNHQQGRGQTGQRDQDDGRKQVLSDPRFALLVCSLAELAAGIKGDITVKDGNAEVQMWRAEVDLDKQFDNVADASELEEADEVFASVVGQALPTLSSKGSCVLDSSEREEVADKVMSRLSTQSKKSPFTSREASNICWALAKLRMAPPCTIYPLGRVVESSDDRIPMRKFVSSNEMSLDVLSSSLKVRMALFEHARSRKLGGGTSGSWIPELSRLAGKIIDIIAVQIINDYFSRNVESDVNGINGPAVGRKKAAFNPQEMASILWAFAKSKRGDEILFDIVANELLRQTKIELAMGGQGPKPQELSNTIWAFATAGIRGDRQVELVKFIADTLDEGSGNFFGVQFKPQEFSNTVWALSTLHSRRSPGTPDESTEDDGIVRVFRWVAKDLIDRVESYKPQEISNSVWAFATVGFGYNSAKGANAIDSIHVRSEDYDGDREMIFDTLEVVAKNASSRLNRFKAQELNNLLWGYAKLGHRSEAAEELFKGVAKELARRTWQFKSQDVGTTLWSLATVECFDEEAFTAGASRLNLNQIRRFKPQEMSNSIWAMATAGFKPLYTRAFDTTLVPRNMRPTKKQLAEDTFGESYAAVALETMRRPHEFKDQELKDVMWSFSRVGIRHPALFKSTAEHVIGREGRGLSSFSSQGLGNLLWSYAKQAQLSLEVIEALGDDVNLVTTGRLAVYETSCLDNGEANIKGLFVEAARAVASAGAVASYSNQDLSNTVWSFATLGLLHSALFKSVENEVKSRLMNNRTKFRGQEISNLLWSFATVNAQPDPSFIDAMSHYIAGVCTGRDGIREQSLTSLFTQRQELANLAWGCAVVGQYPKDLMNILYAGLLGTNNDPDHMRRVFNDDGLEKSSIMTLYYVQIAADIEAPELKLALPEGFPNGWGVMDGQQRTRSKDGDDLAQQSSSILLTLTVSKLQRHVGSAFDAIGFDHELEYVIDTNQIRDELPNEIVLTQSPMEFLSIDLANVEKRIGVEVDGPGHFVHLLDKPPRRRESEIIILDDMGDNRFNGPTTLKHRLLSHLDWDIIHLPYWEFQKLDGDSRQQQDYCRNLIQSSNKW